MCAVVQSHTHNAYVSTITIRNRPPGSGKSYGSALEILTDTSHELIICFSKLKSARGVIEEKLKQVSIEKNLYLEYIGKTSNRTALFYKTRTAMIVIRTIDSLMFSLKPSTIEELIYGTFENIATNIANNGPRETPKVLFNEDYISVGPDTLLFLDEATQCTTAYANALIKIATSTNCDILAVGDILQSTLVGEENAMVRFVNTQHTPTMHIVYDDANEIRRFGKMHVEFRNILLEHTSRSFFGFNITPPISIKASDHCQNDTIHGYIMDTSMDTSHKDVCKKVWKWMLQLIKLHAYLPNDFMVVSPYINKSKLINSLETYIADKFMSFLFHNKDLYATRVEEYDDAIGAQSCAVVHRSQGTGPIDTSISVNSVRMVSIHSSQGDERPCVAAIDLDESKLTYMAGDINLHYISMLNVAVTRQQMHLLMHCTRLDKIGSMLPYCITQENLDIDPESCASLIHDENSIKGMFEVPVELPWNNNIQNVSHTFNKTMFSQVTRNVVDQKYHYHKKAVMHTAFLICSMSYNGKTKQFYAILKKLGNAQVRYVTYNDLFDKNLTGFCILNYKHPSSGQQKIISYIKTRIENVRHLCVLLCSNASKDEIITIISEQYATIDIVLFYFYFSLANTSSADMITFAELYRIANAYMIDEDDALYDHFSVLRDCVSSLNEKLKSIVYEYGPGKFDDYRPIELSGQEGKKIHGFFGLRCQVPYSYVTEKKVVFFKLEVETNEINFKDIMNIIEVQNFFVQRMFTGKLNKTVEDFHNKDIEFVIISQNSDVLVRKQYKHTIDSSTQFYTALYPHFEKCINRYLKPFVALLLAERNTARKSEREQFPEFLQDFHGNNRPNLGRKIDDAIETALDRIKDEMGCVG